MLLKGELLLSDVPGTTMKRMYPRALVERMCDDAKERAHRGNLLVYRQGDLQVSQIEGIVEEVSLTSRGLEVIVRPLDTPCGSVWLSRHTENVAHKLEGSTDKIQHFYVTPISLVDKNALVEEGEVTIIRDATLVGAQFSYDPDFPLHPLWTEHIDESEVPRSWSLSLLRRPKWQRSSGGK